MILIVDDDQAVLASLRFLLRQHDYDCACVKGHQTAMDFIHKQRPDLVLMDMNFSVKTTGEEGLKLLQEMLKVDASIPVILMTGWASLDLAIRGMKAGARDFVSKPWDNRNLLKSIETTLAVSQHQAVTLRRQCLDEQYDFGHIIGEDKGFVQILESVARIAQTDASVLILGENGTGKELIAEALHQNSLRRDSSFVKVNLGGISNSLFESELFGHKKEAYTGAAYDREGRFSLANGGTIFLDEIGELSLASQVKLLRVLQDQSFEALGSSQTQKVDVRVISATNRDLSEEVEQGTFREDLFYRINLITLKLPALRERAGDIPLLAAFYLENLRRLYKRPGLCIKDSAMDWLQEQSFPGNIRQLKNLVERTVLMTAKDRLEIDDFRLQLNKPRRSKDGNALPEVGAMTLEEIEREMIVKAMKHHNHKVVEVAGALGITRNALYRRLDKYNLSTKGV